MKCETQANAIKKKFRPQMPQHCPSLDVTSIKTITKWYNQLRSNPLHVFMIEVVI